MYKCPKCGSKDHLDVYIETYARLIQPDDAPEDFSTDLDEAVFRDHEWDGDSGVVCRNGDCDWGGCMYEAAEEEMSEEGEKQDNEEAEAEV
jgi:hypothetical protein